MRVQQLIDDLAMLPTEADVLLEVGGEQLAVGQAYLVEGGVVLIPSTEGE